MSTETANAQLELVVKMAITAWEAQNTRINKMIDSFSDEQWLTPIAPGKNRGVYLLGHLTAVNDNMIPLLGFGEKFYPQLGAIFLASADKPETVSPTLSELKQYWNTVNTKLAEDIHKLTSADWFDRHTSVSPEDFAKEPHRNKLSVLLNRTSHQSYHVGQLVLLEKK